MRNALSYVPKAHQSMAAAALRQAFIQPDRGSASQALRHVADQLRAKWPKLGVFIDDSETDVLAHMGFPVVHRAKIHSTDALDKRDLVGSPFLPGCYRAFATVLSLYVRVGLGFGFSDHALTNRA